MKKIRIAITGGIGSGKSTVCNIIKDLGFEVVSCDDVYTQLLDSKEFVLKICEITCTEPISSDKGHLFIDRAEISRKVFEDSALKSRLERFTHPVIMDECISRLKDVNGPAFVEVPLLFENGLEKFFDHVIVVMRPIKERVASVFKRSGLTEEQVKQRINNQFDYENFTSNVHTVLYNGSSVEELKKNTGDALEKIFKAFN